MAASASAAETAVAILSGGRGTRLQEKTHAIPKALVEIGGKPILWHVIRIYAAQGFRRFLLLTGHLGEMVADYAASEDWRTRSPSTASTPGRTPQRAAGWPAPLIGSARDTFWTTSRKRACSNAIPLERVSADGRLAALGHHGFWDCMDTYKDAITLNDLWRSGTAPWHVWERQEVDAA